MLQTVKCLPGKRDDLSSNRQHPYEKSEMARRGGVKESSSDYRQRPLQKKQPTSMLSSEAQSPWILLQHTPTPKSQGEL